MEGIETLCLEELLKRETPTGQAAGTDADFVTNQEIRNEGYKKVGFDAVSIKIYCRKLLMDSLC